MAQQILDKNGVPMDGRKPQPVTRAVQKPVDKPAEKPMEGKHEDKDRK